MAIVAKIAALRTRIYIACTFSLNTLPSDRATRMFALKFENGAHSLFLIGNISEVLKAATVYQHVDDVE